MYIYIQVWQFVISRCTGPCHSGSINPLPISELQDDDCFCTSSCPQRNDVVYIWNSLPSFSFLAHFVRFAKCAISHPLLPKKNVNPRFQEVSH